MNHISQIVQVMPTTTSILITKKNYSILKT